MPGIDANLANILYLGISPHTIKNASKPLKTLLFLII